MTDICMITLRFLKNQREMFRLAANQGFSQKVIHMETGMSLSALSQYARGEMAMGGPAIAKLAEMKDLPSELLSMLFDGTGRHIVDGEDEESALDDLGDAADEVASEVRKARHPHSPGGTEIVDIEEARIRSKALRLRRKVA